MPSELPGQFPFTRGIYRDMYGQRLWTMRQYAGFGTAEESNARYRYLLAQGNMGLSVAFDLPTQMGMDPDHPLAEGEVGRVGVSICSLDDMQRLFEGIALESVSTSMTINSTAAILLAFYVLTAKAQGANLAKLPGTIQNDILKEYIARGTYIYPPKPAMRLITDIFAWAARELPEWNTISISGYHIREAGSTAAQEIGFTLADAIAYVEAALGAGLAVDDFAPRLSFFFNSHNGLFEEVAKFRAARRMYARLMRGRFGAKSERACMMRFHAQTSGATLTAQQPENNAIRVAYQALAAILGGAQSLHTNGRDEALGLPTEESVRLALRTQQVLAYETGVTREPDPLGGSEYVERLTNEMEAEAEAIINKIDQMGGMLAAIERRYPQQEIQNAAYAYQRGMEAGGQVIVGLNRFAEEGAVDIPLFRPNPEMERTQRGRVAQLRAGRDSAATAAALDRLEEAARATANLMPLIMDAAAARATVGEMSDRLRRVFGEYQGEG
jgi:methylmalonyl-CoA mutase, N-terminal domain